MPRVVPEARAKAGVVALTTREAAFQLHLQPGLQQFPVSLEVPLATSDPAREGSVKFELNKVIH